jgi:hypothetical protein
MRRKLVCALAAGSALAAAAASAATVPCPASRDNTLYEHPTGALSNGSGQFTFAGTTAMDDVRRTVIGFDLDGIPAGATVTSATVTLHMSKTIVGPVPIALHRLTQEWGEEGSDAAGEEGAGAPAMIGDATWLHAGFPDLFWATPGGDFVAQPSASTVVDQNGTYDWGSTPELVADVQGWVDDKGSNVGWILIADESVFPTAKRFDSREHPDPAVRPVLTVTYEGGAPVPALSASGIALLALFVMVTTAVVLRRRSFAGRGSMR